MSAVNWRRVDAILADVMKKPPGEREQFLDTACAQDPPEIRASIKALLEDEGGLSKQLEEFLALVVRETIDKGFLPAGTRLLDRYTIQSVVGQGGMADVYKATDDRLPHEVAVKVISAELALAAGPEVRERFQAEAKAMTLLKDERFVRIYDTGLWKQRPFLVMELVAGGSLEEQSPAKQPPQDAARLIASLADAVSQVHALDIVHCDLKPANILLPRSANVLGNGPLPLKISDFGIARFRAEPGQTRERVVGTPAYMAPEQWVGDVSQVGPATDVYALGVILYERLTGKLPLDPAGRPREEFKLLITDLNNRPPRPRQLEKAVPAILEAICLKCLEKNPKRRYSSARALAKDVEHWLHNEPPEEAGVTVGPWIRLWLWCQRNPLGASLVVLLLLSAVLANLAAQYMESEAVKAAGGSNTRAAEMVADNLGWLLWDLSRTVVEKADQEDVQKLLRQAAKVKSPEEAQGFLATEGRATDDQIRQLFKDTNQDLTERGIPAFATWLLINKDGYCVAHVGLSVGESNILGLPFDWRDYFKVARTYYEKGWSGMKAVHISHAFKSQSDGLYKFCIAVPVVDDQGSFLGVMAATIPMHHTLGLGPGWLHGGGQKAVLVGRMDRNRPPPENPLGLDVPTHDYQILLHEVLQEREGLRKQELPFRPRQPWPEIDSKQRDELLPRPKAPMEPDVHYSDPLAQIDREKYGGRRLAGFARVRNTELMVISQQRYDDAIGWWVSWVKTSSWVVFCLAFLGGLILWIRARPRRLGKARP